MTNTTVDKLFLSCLFWIEWWCMHIFVKEHKIILVISLQAPEDLFFYCSSSWESLCKWSSLSLHHWSWDLQGPPSSALRLEWELSSGRLLLSYSSKVLRAWSRSTALVSPGACEKCTLSGSTPLPKQRPSKLGFKPPEDFHTRSILRKAIIVQRPGVFFGNGIGN